MTDLNETLEKRGDSYGPFIGHAAITQELKSVTRHHLSQNPQYKDLPLSSKCIVDEALDMIFHKIGRIANGDPRFLDSWHDIAGYATIAEKFLQEADK